MRARRNGSNGNGTPVVRAAIYTRKSTDEGLDRDFNSLDAQREAAESYIKSQAGNGWIALPDRFNDGGFSGGNLERPALKRLLADIAAEKVDRIVVYKIDRLSRSLMDFSELARVFEDHGVGIVSVTQQLDTSTSMGRLTLNMLLSFAQFEREMVSDRTRDKLRAARRKGKFTGGGLILGFDRHPDGGRLVVNEPEARRVREIFRIFVENQSITGTVQELGRREWTLKRWKTKDDKIAGGGTFDVHNLRRLLTNHAYIGKVLFEQAVHVGEHEAIVDSETWEQVQALIGKRGGPRSRSTRSGSLLAGILRCAPCDAAMSPTYSQRNGRRYRYYVCQRAHRQGWDACPTRSVPAAKIEGFVVDQIRAIGRDPDLVAATVVEASRQLEERRRQIETEIRQIRDDLDGLHSEARKEIVGATRSRTHTRWDERRDEIVTLEARLVAHEAELATLSASRVDPDDLRAALAGFDDVWDHLTAFEQADIIRQLIQRIDYDGGTGALSFEFAPAGDRFLAKRCAAAQDVQ